MDKHLAKSAQPQLAGVLAGSYVTSGVIEKNAHYKPKYAKRGPPVRQKKYPDLLNIAKYRLYNAFVRNTRATSTKMRTMRFIYIHILNRGDNVMKLKYVTALIGALTLFTSAQSIAGEHHTAQALEHSAMATAHGQDGHADVLLKHAEEGLKHAEAAEKEHAEAHTHMTEAVKHLKEAIDHAKKGHADVATQHTEEAMKHMRQSVPQYSQ